MTTTPSTDQRGIADPPVSDLGALLDGLDAHLAVVGADGTITAVNAAWRRFAVDNGGDLARCAEGASYFEACRGRGRTATRVARAIRRVATGELESFSTEYPADGPGAQRWFTVRVLPLPTAGQALVAHHEVSAERGSLRRVGSERRLLDVVTGVGPDDERTLAERAPRQFAVLVDRWCDVLRRPGDDVALADLAAELVALDATSRDAVHAHVTAHGRRDRTAPDVGSESLTDDSRFVLIRVVGLMADAYRARGR